MTHEYRLKQWYPSLPEDWKEGEIVVVREDVSTKVHRFILHPDLKSKYTSNILGAREVTQYPEFWEEIEFKIEFRNLQVGDRFYYNCFEWQKIDPVEQGDPSSIKTLWMNARNLSDHPQCARFADHVKVKLL